MRVATLANKEPWKDRALPRPLSFELAMQLSDNNTSTPGATTGEASSTSHNTVQSVADAARQFIDCAQRLSSRPVRNTLFTNAILTFYFEIIIIITANTV